ncbi:MAG: hypothetical protein ABIL09_11085 [Gemmatimonadota bacterium]
MSSLEAQVRAAILAEVQSWTLGVTPTWVVQSPEPGSLTNAPRAALWLQTIRLDPQQPEDVQDELVERGVCLLGEKDADVVAMFWASSEDDYDVILEDFQRAMFFEANPTMVQEIGVSIYGIDTAISLYWSGPIDLATPIDTGIRDLWRVQFRGTVAYPWLVQEAEGEESGLLGITVTNVNDEGDYDLDDYEGD